MLQSQTAVLERNTVLSGDFATEPFEVAWAREGRWYLQVLERAGDPTADLVTQVSPDGLTWADLEGSDVTMGSAALTTWPVSEFGHWLRVRGSVSEGASIKVRIYLALKS